MKNMISIYSDSDTRYRVYFNDRNGNRVFAYMEDPQTLLNMRQKEQFFMGDICFLVNDSDIKYLDKLINWPA
jgi:hypothetical protein